MTNKYNIYVQHPVARGDDIEITINVPGGVDGQDEQFKLTRHSELARVITPIEFLLWSAVLFCTAYTAVFTFGAIWAPAVMVFHGLIVAYAGAKMIGGRYTISRVK